MKINSIMISVLAALFLVTGFAFADNSTSDKIEIKMYNLRGQVVSVFEDSVEKLIQRGYLTGESVTPKGTSSGGYEQKEAPTLFDNQRKNDAVILVNEALPYEKSSFLGRSEMDFIELYRPAVQLSPDEIQRFPALLQAIDNIGKSNLNKIQGFSAINATEKNELKRILMERAFEKTGREGESTRAIIYNGQEYHIDIDLFTEEWDYTQISIESFDPTSYRNKTFFDLSGFVTLHDEDLEKMPKLKEALLESKDVPISTPEHLEYQSHLDRLFEQKYSKHDVLLSQNIIQYNDEIYVLDFMLDVVKYDANCKPGDVSCYFQ